MAPKLATVAVLIGASALGISHFANSKKEIDRHSDLAQWVARNLASRTGEEDPVIYAKDADDQIKQFIEETQVAIEEVDALAFDKELYSLENLAMLNQAAEIDDSDPILKTIGHKLAAKERLMSAHHGYQAAANLAPMRFENHLTLARLDLILCPGASVRNRIALVHTINPTSGIDASKAGIISVINGDFEVGGALLAQALRDEPRLEVEIFDVLRSQMSVQEIAKHVLKQDAHLMIRAADRFYTSNDQWTERSFLYSQLRQAIESGTVTGLTEAETKYYLAKSKRMSGEIEGAITDLEAACEGLHTPREWLNELVSLYEEKGDLRKVRSTLVRISIEYADPGIEKQIEAIDKRRSSRKGMR